MRAYVQTFVRAVVGAEGSRAWGDGGRGRLPDVGRTSLLCVGLLSGLLGASASGASPDCLQRRSSSGQRQCLSVPEIVAKMSLSEKIGQMTQANKLSVAKAPDDIARLSLGSILSGGGEAPDENTPEAWAELTRSYQERALSSRLGIPLIYGIDAVHGHNNVRGATFFPHNIGLGATRDAALLEKIGYITGREVAATGIHWNFAPAVSVPQDLRWGRAYEGFSENTDVVTMLSSAYLTGLQTTSAVHNSWQVAGTAKHYIGDGGTGWGTSDNAMYKIDQGDTVLSEDELRRIHLPPYVEAIKRGVPTVMASFSKWNGVKMHAHHYLLTDVLKGELGFSGFVISDWLGVFQLPGSLDEQVAAAVNAGVDMVMAVDRYEDFIKSLKKLVRKGVVPMARIDDAVTRILLVKQRMGLFRSPFGDASALPDVGSTAHRQVAREAVQKSLVLLKNEEAVLPLDAKRLLVAGQFAHNKGLQSGGWTIAWQGHVGNNEMPGVTLLDGLKNQAPADAEIHYAANLSAVNDTPYTAYDKADVGVVVVGEYPYAEGFGDDGKLELSHDDRKQIAAARELCHKLVVVLISGRPLMVTDILPQVEGFVAAWLPGPEGDGVGDVLWGRVPFTGTLPVTWPARMDGYQGYPLPAANILFPFGDGLTTAAIR